MSERKENWQGMNWIRQDKRLALYHRDGFCCIYCGARAEEKDTKLTLDHVLAVELGGTNHESNLITACFSCNSAKQHKTLRSWFAALREKGVDTASLSTRIRRQTAKPIDRAEGKRLLALRME